MVIAMKRHFMGLTLLTSILIVSLALPAFAGDLDDVFKARGRKPQKMDIEELQFVVGSLDEAQQKKLLEDKELFNKFLEQEQKRKSLLFAAQKHGVKKGTVEEYLVRRQAEQLLIKHYLREQLKKRDENYPSAEQIQAYYDNNKESFVLEERVHISQIFLPLEAGGSEKDAADLEKKAGKIVKDISRGKLNFADAATRYSGHAASRLNGGYMGLVKMSALLPEIKEAVKTLKVGQVSQPVRAEDGFHILKLGGRVAEQPVSFDQVKESIRQLLIKEKLVSMRQQIVDKALEKYPPVKFSEKEVEKMRKKLMK
jgi:peptidylprolyl isomerase